MAEFPDAFAAALRLVLTLDAGLAEISAAVSEEAERGYVPSGAPLGVSDAVRVRFEEKSAELTEARARLWGGADVSGGPGRGRTEESGVEGVTRATVVGLEAVGVVPAVSPRAHHGCGQAIFQPPLYSSPSVSSRCRLTAATRRLNPSWLRLMPR